MQLVTAESADRVRDLFLVTTDLTADRATMVARGVPVGPRDYASFADFADPDGNTWTLQERGRPAAA